MRYIIKGDTEQFNDCLICVCGNSQEQAEKCLIRMLNNPTENDKCLIAGHKNLRIEELKDKDCWWEFNCD